MDFAVVTKPCQSPHHVVRPGTVKLSGRSTLKTAVKASYNWTISDFEICSENMENIRSPVFSHPNLSKWCVELEKNIGNVRLCFCLLDSSDSQPVGVTLKASISDREGTKCQVYQTEFCTLHVAGRSPLQCITASCDTDNWNFECEVYIVEVVTEDTSHPFKEEQLWSFTRDLGHLWESKQFADFTVSAGGIEFETHTAILSARSPVFEAMLLHDTKEARDRRVEITDVDPGVLSKMLRYMYSDVLPPSDITYELFAAFDKYGLREAMLLCELELARRLTVENAAATAACAVFSSSIFLQKVCMAFIKRHLEQVVRTRGWAYIIENSTTAVRTISELITRGSEWHPLPADLLESHSDATTMNSSALEFVSEDHVPVSGAGTSDTMWKCGYTHCERKAVFYTWTISGLCNWPQGRDFVASKPFSLPETADWELRLYKHCDSGYNMRFHLLKYKSGGNVKVDLGFCVGPSEMLWCTRKGCIFSEGSESVHDFLCGYSLQDELILKCEISMLCPVHHWLEPVKPVPYFSVAKDLLSLKESGILADFILCAGTVEIRVHRAILATRSPFFARVLQPGSELLENRLEFPDVKPRVLDKVLCYMYADVVVDLYADASVEILMAAHNFELYELKRQIEVFMIQKLRVHNAVAIAVFALESQIQCDYLLEYTVGFIESHFEAVKYTSGWEEATNSHQTTVEKICQLVAECNRQKRKRKKRQWEYDYCGNPHNSSSSDLSDDSDYVDRKYSYISLDDCDPLENFDAW